MDEGILAHYGVLGMKWGVRRYQNKDGSYTPQGRQRYRKSPEQVESEAQKKSVTRNRGALTNAELKEWIERQKLEIELRELTKTNLSPAQRFVEDVLKDVGKKTLTTMMTGAALYGAKAAVGKQFDRKELAEAIFNGGPKKK